VSPILFAIHTSELIKCVEDYVTGAEELSFVDDLGWVATGRDVNRIVMILEICAAQRIKWESRQGLQFDTATTKRGTIDAQTRPQQLC